MGSILFSLVSLCLISFVLSSPCDTVVLFQCPTKGAPSNTTYLPMQCQSNGLNQFKWGLAASTFEVDVVFNDIQYDPISCAGKDNMLYYLTQDWPHKLLGFDLSNGGRQVMNVETQDLSEPFWMLQYPLQPNLFLVMANYNYGTLDANTGKFTSLYALKSEFEGVGFRQRSLSSDFKLVWFEALYSFGQYKPQCLNSCMVAVDPLTGIIEQVQTMDVEANWISSSPLPPSSSGKQLDRFASIFVNQSDVSHRVTFSGSIALPSGGSEKPGLFSGPVTYTPQGDFDVSDGPYGQFYYVTNAGFSDRTKYYRQIDMKSGEEILVLPISDETVNGLCDSNTFTTSAVTFVGHIHKN